MMWPITYTLHLFDVYCFCGLSIYCFSRPIFEIYCTFSVGKGAAFYLHFHSFLLQNLISQAADDKRKKGDREDDEKWKSKRYNSSNVSSLWAIRKFQNIRFTVAPSNRHSPVQFRPSWRGHFIKKNFFFHRYGVFYLSNLIAIVGFCSHRKSVEY